MGQEADREGATERAWLRWAPMLVGALSSYGGVAFNYGFALYFLSYRHGFVKRGLVGELFAGFAWLPRGVLLGIEYGFLASAFIVTYLVFRRMLFGSAAECRLAAALLSGPALLSHLGFVFEQPDVTLYLLLMGCMALFLSARPTLAAVGSCVLCSIALLGHEAFSLLFYPLIVAVLWRLCSQGKLPWLAGVAHVLVVLAVFLAVIHWGKLKVSPDVVLHEAQARTNVGIQRQAYDVMASSLARQRALVREMYGSYMLRVTALTLLFSMPYFVLLWRLLNGAMRRSGFRWVERMGTVLLFLAPLLLFPLGHDTTRWLGAVCTDATLFVLYLYLAEPRESASSEFLRGWACGPTFVPWMVYLIAVGPYGATGMRTAEQFLLAWFGS